MALHIHLPKPLHGWKAFLNEIFVIVIGILIALGLEQVLERWHRRHQANEGIATLRQELGWNHETLNITMADAGCMLGNMDQLRQLVEANSTAQVRTFFPPDHRHFNRNDSFRAIRFGGWEAAKSSGMLAHLTTGERLGYSKAYDFLERVQATNGDTSRRARDIEARAAIFDGTAHAKSELLLAIAQYRSGFPSARFYKDVTMHHLARVGADLSFGIDPAMPPYVRCLRWPQSR